MITIMAIDPGWERTGVAVVSSDGSASRIEVLRFASRAKAGASLGAWMEPARVRAVMGRSIWGAPSGWAAIWRPDAVVIEIPPAVPPRRGRGFDQTPSRRLGELVGILGAVLDSEGIPVYRVEVAAWRRGVGVPGGATKDEIVANASTRLRAIGQLEVLERHSWRIADGRGTGPRADAAEAYLIGCYASARVEFERRAALASR